MAERHYRATVPFMVRDHATGIPRHFAPSSGPIPHSTLDALDPPLNVVQSFLDQGVLEEVPAGGEAKERVELVGHPVEAMQYVSPQPPSPRGQKRKL